MSARRSLVSALAVAALLLAGACSSDDEESASTTAPSDVADDAAASGDEALGDDLGDLPDFSDVSVDDPDVQDFCDEMAVLDAEMRTALAEAGPDEQLELIKGAFERMDAVAPAAIADDVGALAEAYAGVETPDDALEAELDESLQEAAVAVDEFTFVFCDIELGG